MSSDRVAVIVGGGSGLGAATAELLSERWSPVLVGDIDEERAQSVAGRLINSAAQAVDVSDDESVATLFDRAAKLGSVGVVVNCAGLGHAERLLGRRGIHRIESFRRIVDVNFIGTFSVLRHAARVMSRDDPDPDGLRGCCVTTASVAAFDGQAGQVAYAASKGGVAALTLASARDLSPLGIRVCSIAPGVFDTPLFAGLPDAAKQRLLADVPAPWRAGRPREFARLVEQIVTNPMLNGEVIRLDGSLRMPYVRPSGDIPD